MEQEETKKTNDTTMMPKHYHKSLAKIVLGLIFVLVIAAVSFGIGRVSNRRTNSFPHGSRMMSGREITNDQTGFGRGFAERGSMMNGSRRGVISGAITNISGDTLTVKDTDGTEYTVNVSSTTSIIIAGKVDKLSNLKSNESVRIFGPSNSDGSINAQLINAL